VDIFLTGATGYIGGSVAVRLIAAGHHVRGLVRSSEKAGLLAKFGVKPVLGGLDEVDLLAREARKADAVVNAANADHLPSARAFVTALAGTGKPLVHTSGSSVIGDDARGNRVVESIFDEDTPFVVPPAKQPRRDIDLMVLAAAGSGVRSAVICPTIIYGTGRGANPQSVQIPFLADNARRHGFVQVVGRGVNRWSTVHIDDLVELYLLVLEKAPAGAFYFAENGETSFGEIGEAIAARLGLGPVQSLPAESAAEKWGESRAYYSFGSNSRVRAKRARRELGWAPRHTSVISWILSEMPI
jgi:nucleoside-diphosphate-sugar epimerase